MDDWCAKCWRWGHSSDECRRPFTSLLLALALSGCASPQVITDAKDCEAQGGCVVVSWAVIHGLSQRSFMDGVTRAAEICRREGT